MSWSRTQAAGFAAQGVALRTAVDSLACVFRGAPVDLCLAPLQRVEVLTDQGPRVMLTTTARFPVALFPAGNPPVEGETITVTPWNVVLVITGTSPQTLAPEWRIHLQQQ